MREIKAMQAAVADDRHGNWAGSSAGTGRWRLARLGAAARSCVRVALLLLLCLSTAQSANLGFQAQAQTQARPGDVLGVPLAELRPTQGAIGYDQIYYTLGRWQADFDRPTWQFDEARHLQYLRATVGKKFDSYCAVTGQGGLAAGSLTSIESLQAARLNQAGSFACTDAPGTHAQDLKTVVVGWNGKLYLTDGHHSLSSLYEAEDGGADLQVWVRVDANYYLGSQLSAGLTVKTALRDADAPTAVPDATVAEAAFWQQMVAENKAWLRDGDNRPLVPAQLPSHLGLAGPGNPDGLQDDPYRALVYFARDIGYDNGSLPEFAEFMWADWLRKRLDLSRYAVGAPAPASRILAPATWSAKTLSPGGSHDSYAAAVRDSALLMGRMAQAETRIAGTRTAAALGRIALQEGASAGSPTGRARKALAELPRSDTNRQGRYRNAGKLWLAVNYKLCGRPQAATACWGY